MHSETFYPEKMELVHSHPDNLLLIENHEDTVVIRAARDNFSSQEKEGFIRYLAAEGYIPDCSYRWAADSDGGVSSGLKWIVDRSWLKIPTGTKRKAEREVLRLMIYAGLVWCTLMGLVVGHVLH